MYRETITDEELCDARSAAEAERIARSRIRLLMERSGAKNVASAVLRRHARPDARFYEISVSFDSRAWTGRGF